MEKVNDKLLVWGKRGIDDKTIEQAEHVAEKPFVWPHLALMPDAHVGVGCTIGSVIPFTNAIMPSAVGVDIGCGMIAYCFPDKRFNYKYLLKTYGKEKLDNVLRAIHNRLQSVVGYARQPAVSKWIGDAVLVQDQDNLEHLWYDVYLETLFHLKPDWFDQLGTLGGGNHFLELSQDGYGRLWIVLHSGSRGIGNQIGRFYTEKARELDFSFGVKTDNADAFIPDTVPLFEKYLRAIEWGKIYASMNRDYMLQYAQHVVKDELGKLLPYEPSSGDMIVESVHNYIATENRFGRKLYVARKGAIVVSDETLGVIPGSMGTSTFIVSGKKIDEGNASMNSAPHGAGRAMSRREARDRFNEKDLESSMEGIICRPRKAIIDEVPQSYKDINNVMEDCKELCTPKFELHQLINVKGD